MLSNDKITRKERLITHAILLIVSFLFLLFFSLWESPLYKYWYGCDASFFSMAGRGITQGWVPYVDFFDLKGPYFFFIEALAQLIHTDRLGIFIIEIPFLYVSLFLIYEICRMFVSKLKTLTAMIITLFLHIATLWGGNTLEEYMLPFTLLALYLTLKFGIKVKDASGVASGDKSVDYSVDFSELPWYVPLITGISFGIMLFSKVTVGAPIAGIVITVCITCLISKKYKEILKYLGLSLLGVIIAVAPILIYFLYNGALSQMLYCVFTFAMKRSVDYSETFNYDWEFKTFGCYFAFFFAILHPKQIKRPLWILLLSMSVITYVLLHLGVPFIYYFTTVFPVFILAFILFLDVYDPLILFKNVKQFVCLAILAVILYYYAHVSIDTITTAAHRSESTWYEDDYNEARDLAKLIPTWEKDQVFSFSIDMIWFEANQMLPCYKYPINLQFFIDLDPRIETDIADYLNNTPPKWLVIGDNFSGEIPSLFEIVDSKYECICTNNSGNLYMLKE